MAKSKSIQIILVAVAVTALLVLVWFATGVAADVSVWVTEFAGQSVPA